MADVHIMMLDKSTSKANDHIAMLHKSTSEANIHIVRLNKSTLEADDHVTILNNSIPESNNHIMVLCEYNAIFSKFDAIFGPDDLVPLLDKSNVISPMTLSQDIAKSDIISINDFVAMHSKVQHHLP